MPSIFRCGCHSATEPKFFVQFVPYTWQKSKTRLLRLLGDVNTSLGKTIGIAYLEHATLIVSASNPCLELVPTGAVLKHQSFGAGEMRQLSTRSKQ